MSKPLRKLFLSRARIMSALAVTFLSVVSQADTFTESFDRASDIYQAGLVWNLSLHELHPPLLISGWDAGAGSQNTSFSVGDGSDGDFVPAHYSQFGSVTANVISIDTDIHPNLQFTSFHLAAGYTLRPVGSNPLVIRSQSSVLIDGTIDCSGANGSSSSGDFTASVSGGLGRCGGGSGGASVPAAQAPNASHQGGAGGTHVTGGGGGPQAAFVTGGQGGGGGGAYVKAHAVASDKPNPTAGGDSNGGAGGAAGAIFQDDGFSSELAGAGSGGGGGSAYSLATVAGHSSGAGGGAGGGNIQIYAVQNVTISATGAILANGGAGGSVAGPALGGGGGGGGGGSILIFAGGHISTFGPVTASNGASGASGGAAGGAGAWGRTWIVESAGYATAGTPEDPISNLVNPGLAQYETGVVYTVKSSGIDLGTSKPTILALSTPAVTVANQGAATIVYDLAFSTSSDPSSFSTYAASTSFLGQQVQRYVSFQLQLNNTSATTPIVISSLGFTYDDFIENKFAFTTGCGATKSSLTKVASLPVAPLFFLPLVFVFILRRKK